MAKNQHVTPHPKGGWQVKSGGSDRATTRTTTQAQAFDKARSIAKSQGCEVVVHKSNGVIRAKHSYGNDPFPPKG